MRSAVSKLKDLDMFGEGIGFNVGKGKSKQGTYLGTCMSILVVVSLLAYGQHRFTMLSNHDETKYMKTLYKDKDYQRNVTLRDTEIVPFIYIANTAKRMLHQFDPDEFDLEILHVERKLVGVGDKLESQQILTPIRTQNCSTDVKK